MRRVLAFSVCCVLGAGLAACGGGERQDAGDAGGDYQVDVVASDFPAEQSISSPATLKLAVRNTGDRTIPDLAVSLEGLSTRDSQPGLADPEDPVWIVQRQPGADQTAYDFTWTLGRVEAGATKDFELDLVPAVPGTHEVKWTVAAGLTGKSMASTADGERPAGTFTVRVSDEPAQATVDPDSGAVVRAP
jgi:hypothetical protein